MSNPTSNFGWQMPTPTDLVTDLPADFEVFGQAVDSTMADLKGGTSGQILSKNSNTDMDFVWIANQVGDITGVTAGTGISGGGTSGDVTITNSMATAIDAKGDLIAGTGADAFSRLAVGTNGQTLVADSTTSTGLKWTSTGQGMTLVSRTTFSNVASQIFDNVFTSSYYSYLIEFELMAGATQTDSLYLQFRYGSTTKASGYYGATYGYYYNSSTVAYVGHNNANQLTICQNIGAGGYPGNGNVTVNCNPNGYGTIGAVGSYYSAGTAIGQTMQAGCSNPETFTGFLLKSSSSNISGTVAIYGLAI